MQSGPPPQQSSDLGRSLYVPAHVPINEEDAAQYQPSTTSPFSRNTIEQITIVDPISNSLHYSLIKGFLIHCRPWMPLISEVEIRRLEPGSLLLNAILVAGSKVSTSPRAVDVGERYYQQARKQFLAGDEADAVSAITATVFLQWWNPSGPEHVSINNSSFWLRMGVALAQQIGLHREPGSRQSNRRLRRKLWWTLVVCDSNHGEYHLDVH